MNYTEQAINKKVERFVEEYARGQRGDGAQAAIRAGFPPATANVDAVVLLMDPEVRQRIDARIAEIDHITSFSEQDVLREWILLATADPAKIAKIRQVNCRHCWGIGHEYQWSAREYAQECDRAANHVTPKGVPAPKPPPRCDGGFGWVRNAPPNPDCPECRGEGEFDAHFANMDSLGPAERKLIAGVKRTKDGVEIKMRDQDAAVLNIAKTLGLMVEKREITGKNGGPIGVATIPVDLPQDPQALGALYTQIVGNG